MCAQNEAGNRRGNANQRRRPARHGSGIAVRAFGTRPEDESRHRYQKPSKASTIAARISRTSIAYNLELSWLEPVVANAGPPRRNFAVRIGVGKGTAAAPIGVRSQHRGAWGRRRWRGPLPPPGPRLSASRAGWRLRRSHHRLPAPANHLGVLFTRRSDPSHNANFRIAKLWRGHRRFTHKQVERRLLRFSNGLIRVTDQVAKSGAR